MYLPIILILFGIIYLFYPINAWIKYDENDKLPQEYYDWLQVGNLTSKISSQPKIEEISASNAILPSFCSSPQNVGSLIFCLLLALLWLIFLCILLISRCRELKNPRGREFTNEDGQQTNRNDLDVKSVLQAVFSRLFSRRQNSAQGGIVSIPL